MYLHRENRELFRDIVLITSERMGVTVDIVEKDYYVTMILRMLSKTGCRAVLKGGTSLSKAFGITDRFSEDDDITFVEHLGEEPGLLEQYHLIPFSMTVQAVERTLIDKIFALCDYYIQKKPARNSRHLYDVYKLAQHVTKNDGLKRLVQEVRGHRAAMDVMITPSASPEVDVRELIRAAPVPGPSGSASP